MKKYTETRWMSASELRGLCIRNNWYTRGSNEEYEALLDSLYDDLCCPIHLTTEKLAEIAKNIMQHSRITDYTITSVMYELAANCHTVFDEA